MKIGQLAPPGIDRGGVKCESGAGLHLGTVPVLPE